MEKLLIALPSLYISSEMEINKFSKLLKINNNTFN